MIELFIIIIGLLALRWIILRVILRSDGATDKRGNNHGLCLAHIDEMERELGMGKYAGLDTVLELDRELDRGSGLILHSFFNDGASTPVYYSGTQMVWEQAKTFSQHSVLSQKCDCYICLDYQKNSHKRLSKVSSGK